MGELGDGGESAGNGETCDSEEAGPDNESSLSSG